MEVGDYKCICLNHIVSSLCPQCNFANTFAEHARKPSSRSRLMMFVIRLVTCHLRIKGEAESLELNSGFTEDGVKVRALGAEQVIPRTRCSHRLVVAAVTQVPKGALSRDPSGFIKIPDSVLSVLHDKLESYAYTYGAVVQRHIKIKSPRPHVAFESQSPDEAEWLDHTKGISSQTAAPPHLKATFPVADMGEIRSLCRDRRVGLKMLNRVFADGGAVVLFNSLIQFFQCAFDLYENSLASSLHRFLRDNGCKYELNEIRSWLAEYEMLSNQRGCKPVEADVRANLRAVSFRMKQAALDVLLNKKEWNSHSSQRRDGYKLPVFSVGPDESIYRARQSTRAQVLSSVGRDPFNGYPRDTRHVETYCDRNDWWYRTPDESPPSSEIEVVFNDGRVKKYRSKIERSPS